MTAALGIIATVAGLALALAPLLQAARCLRRRQSDDVSGMWLALVVVGASAWTAYGVALGDAPLVIANATGTAVAIVTLTLVLRFRRESR